MGAPLTARKRQPEPQRGAENAKAHPSRAVSRELDDISLRLAARGDPRASRALVECYQGRVYALISRVLHGAQRSVVDDLAQEVFLRTFRHLDRFDPAGPAKLSTWIYRVGTRLCIDELRKRRSNVHDATEAALEVLSAARLDEPEAAVCQRRLRLALATAIGGLAPEQRAAFVLYEFHGESYAQIAETLELPVGTVRSRISRARKGLQMRLAEHHSEEAWATAADSRPRRPGVQPDAQRDPQGEGQ